MPKNIQGLLLGGAIVAIVLVFMFWKPTTAAAPTPTPTPLPSPAPVVSNPVTQMWSGSADGVDGDVLDLTCPVGAPSLANVIYGGANATSYAKLVQPQGNNLRLVLLPSNFTGQLNGTTVAGVMGPDPQPGVPKTTSIAWNCSSGPGAVVKNATTDWVAL